VAVVLFVAGLHRVGLPLYVVLVVVVTLAGIWSAGAVESWFGRPDDGRIVIDEVAGQLLALAPIVALHGIPLGHMRIPGLDAWAGGGIDLWWLLVVTGFVAFRWFDIRKPGPVKWAEQRFEHGAGVMADDLVAGLLDALVVIVPAYAVVVARLQAVVADGAAAVTAAVTASLTASVTASPVASVTASPVASLAAALGTALAEGGWVASGWLA